jgi:hypothetical protein
LDGVNVAVILEFPTSTTVKVLPEILMTVGVSDVYEKVPVIDSFTVGAVAVKAASP